MSDVGRTATSSFMSCGRPEVLPAVSLRDGVLLMCDSLVRKARLGQSRLRRWPDGCHTYSRTSSLARASRIAPHIAPLMRATQPDTARIDAEPASINTESEMVPSRVRVTLSLQSKHNRLDRFPRLG